MTDKKNIGIIMGGDSSEKEISIKSGTRIYDSISQKKYNCFKLQIVKQKWIAIINQKEYPIDKNDFSIVLNSKKITFDLIINMIHGTPGEDGKILAYLELLDIKHTSDSFYKMALTFNKRDCLTLAKNYEIPCAKSFYLNKSDDLILEQIIQKVGLPCFVKPNRSGSSFGISKVEHPAELLPAIHKAFKEDSEILIESFLDGIEVSVGVITYKNQTIALPVTEIVSENNFFDYDAKYNGKSKEITPARISDSLTKVVQEMAIKVYKKFDLQSISRSEFIIVNNIPYFLEINTVPGMTHSSILPQQIESSGISMQDFVEDLIIASINT